MSVYQQLLNIRQEKGAGFILLIDPDKLPAEQIPDRVYRMADSGVDALFIGGSLLHFQHFDRFVNKVKQAGNGLPVILFPGGVNQISGQADAILFLSVLSGRNPTHLIGNQVQAAPIIRQLGIEPISCAYLLVESGQVTSAEFMSNSHPLPRHKPEIAVAHALAAQYLGFKLIYLEAGSGAEKTVPEEMIGAVSRTVDVPLLVGGGIRTPEEAAAKRAAGASFVVVGNYFEEEGNRHRLREFAVAIHSEPVKNSNTGSLR